MIARRPFLLSLTLAIACDSSGFTPEATVDANAGDGEGADVSSGLDASDAGSEALSTDAVAEDPSPDVADVAVLPGTPLWQVFYDRSFAAHVEIDSKGAALISGTIFKDKDIRVGTTVLTSHGAADIMLSRVLRNGTVDWAKSYGALAADYPVTFRLDKSDRIVMTGLYNGTGNIGGPDFPPFAGVTDRFDVSIAGLTATGEHRWSKTINTTADAFAGGLSLDASGNAFVFGHYVGTATIGAAARPSVGLWDVFLTRFDDPMGTLGASLPFGGTGDERSTVALFTGTDVVLFGTFEGTLTMPTVPPKDLVSVGGRDIFVARVAVDGQTMTSAMSFGGTGNDEVTRAEVDESHNVIITGSFDSPSFSVMGGEPLVPAGGADIFVACLGSDLGHRWSKRFGGDADDRARDLTVGPAGIIGVSGEFKNRITFGDKTYDAVRADAAVSEIDAFVLKLSEEGSHLWSFAIGGPAPDRALSVASDLTGALYVTFAFQSPVDFGFGVLTPDPGQWASALVKMAP